MGTEQGAQEQLTLGRGALSLNRAYSERHEAAGRRHSWFLAKEAQMEAQVPLPAVVYSYRCNQHCCLASQGTRTL